MILPNSKLYRPRRQTPPGPVGPKALPVAGELTTYRVDDLNANGDGNAGWTNGEQIGAFGGKNWQPIGSDVVGRGPLSRGSSTVPYVTDDGFGKPAARFSGSGSLRTPLTTSWGPLAQSVSDFTVMVGFRSTQSNTLRAVWANRTTGVSTQRGADLLYDTRFVPVGPFNVLGELRGLTPTAVVPLQGGAFTVPTVSFNVVTWTASFGTNFAGLWLDNAAFMVGASLAGFTSSVQSTQLYLGGAVNGNRLVGHIYIWTLYPRVLSAAEITTNYDAMVADFT